MSGSGRWPRHTSRSCRGRRRSPAATVNTRAGHALMPSRGRGPTTTSQGETPKRPPLLKKVGWKVEELG